MADKKTLLISSQYETERENALKKLTNTSITLFHKSLLLIVLHETLSQDSTGIFQNQFIIEHDFPPKNTTFYKSHTRIHACSVNFLWYPSASRPSRIGASEPIVRPGGTPRGVSRGSETKGGRPPGRDGQLHGDLGELARVLDAPGPGPGQPPRGGGALIGYSTQSDLQERLQRPVGY